MNWFLKLNKDVRTEVLTAAVSLIWVGSAYMSNNVFVYAGAGVYCLFVIRRWKTRLMARIRRPAKSHEVPVAAPEVTIATNDAPKRPKKRKAPRTAGALIEEFLENGRAALLLRAELDSKVKPEQKQVARQLLLDSMATIQPGKVWMTTPSKTEVEMGAACGLSADVAGVMMDRQAVTNEQFQKFVDDGGYENAEFWCEKSLPARTQFLDQTGCQGPRFWRNGQFGKGEASLPVVGVNWFEARAFARWSGKRIPNGPEWVKAASSPDLTNSVCTQQKKYPWGESISNTQANLWQSGIGRVVPVTQYAQLTPQNICQMVGNVWEWVDDDFMTWTGKSGWDANAGSLKAIRGGAFDTYLESQATVQSQSGEEPYARRHNIGFRCAVDCNRIQLAS